MQPESESTKVKVFFLTSPHGDTEAHTGDSDYTLAMIDLLREGGCAAEHLKPNRPLDDDLTNLISLIQKFRDSGKTKTIAGKLGDFIAKKKMEREAAMQSGAAASQAGDDSDERIPRKKSRRQKSPKPKFSFNEAIQFFTESASRRQVVKSLIEKMLQDPDVRDGASIVLNLQLRPPDSGTLLMPEDLDEIRRVCAAADPVIEVKIMVTCHEYRLNYNRRCLQALTQRYFEKADGVIFFNKQDREKAIEHASHEGFFDPGETASVDQRKIPRATEDYEFTHNRYNLKKGRTVRLSRVLVPLSRRTELFEVKKYLSREPNIMAFGMLRGAKGFEEALDIARVLKENRDDPSFKSLRTSKVIIAGKPTDPSLLAEILKEKFRIKYLEQLSQMLAGGQAFFRSVDKFIKFSQARKRQEKQQLNTGVGLRDLLKSCKGEIKCLDDISTTKLANEMDFLLLKGI